MKLNELEVSARAYDELAMLKQDGARFAKRLGEQLHVPRKPNVLTRRDRRLKNLSNKFVWTDTGELRPDAKEWEYDAPLREAAAPILLPGPENPSRGSNKPDAGFWTSSAIKLDDSSYTSDWNNWLYQNDMLGWTSSVGYLYKIQSNALVLHISTDKDALNVIDIFHDLFPESTYQSDDDQLRLYAKFPWQHVARHFNGVHFNGRYVDWQNTFTYGWDCESTVWLNPSALTLIKEVPVANMKDKDEDF